MSADRPGFLDNRPCNRCVHGVCRPSGDGTDRGLCEACLTEDRRREAAARLARERGATA